MTRRSPTDQIKTTLFKYHWYLAFSGGLLLVSIVLGYLYPLPVKPAGNRIDPEPSMTAFDFIINNLAVAGAIAAGMVSFGATTILGLTTNGYVLGSLVRRALLEGEPPLSVVQLLLPHGLPELLGFCVAGAIGLVTPHLLLEYVLGRRDSIVPSDHWREMLILAGIAIVFIIVAAVIEANISSQ